MLLSCDKIVKIPKVEPRNINCDSIQVVLEEVYKVDQEIRATNIDFPTFVKKGHENLEKVISLIEKCGMPTLQEVNQQQMDAIWLVLHHAPQKEYMKKYLPQLKQAAKNGDIKWNALATIIDRVRMNDGEPQLYGSQISKGKLYDLEEPEYVDQRREEMGMESLKVYLRQFNIRFDVPQKKK